MEHDLVIRGGNIVDGTGAAGVPGDVAIDSGLISAMGTVSGKGKQEIDAKARAASPLAIRFSSRFRVGPPRRR